MTTPNCTGMVACWKPDGTNTIATFTRDGTFTTDVSQSTSLVYNDLQR